MIESVTVYRRGARVRRAVVIQGAPEVVLEGLPLALDDGSVRVRVDGQGARAMDVRIGVDVPPEDPSLAPPRDEELRAQERVVLLSKTEVDRVRAALVRLEGLSIERRARPKRGEAPQPPSAQARLDLARVRAVESERLAKELLAAESALRDHERRLAELRDRERRATSARNAREHELRKKATIRIEGAGEAGARLIFEYFVPGASWTPAYTVWLDGDAARVAMRALVAQRSGEDWRGAKLVLSTADPDRWTELPELPALRIGRAQPERPKRAYREPPEGALALYADYDRAFAELPKAEPAPEPSSVSYGREDLETPVDVSILEAPGAADEVFEPPPEHVMPAPMMPQRKSASVFGAVAGAVMAPAALAASMFTESTRGGEGFPGPPQPAQRRAPPPPPAPSFELDLEAMAYGRLRMFGADSSMRGELRAVGAAEVYAEGITMKVDVAIAIHAAVHRASVESLPSGYVEPEAPDSFDYAYACDVPADVPSDGAFHVVPVTEHRARANMRYVTVPREASEVFRVLELECGDYALLEGPADVYAPRDAKGADYSYLLTTEMPATPPGGELSLGLGVEQAIKVARNVTFAEQSTGLLGGGLALVHDIAIDLKNNLRRPVTVEVRERIPTKREDDDDVEIETGPVRPKWEEWDQDDSLSGGRAWTVEVGPGREEKLEARYVVRISSKQQLVGGNRRES